MISEAQPAHSKRSLAISDYAPAGQHAKTGIAHHLAQSTRARGAEIIKIEPREGYAARRIGPFEGSAGPERSLFWYYNRNKKIRTTPPNLRRASGCFVCLTIPRMALVHLARHGAQGSRIAIACFTDAEWRHAAASPRNQLMARTVSL